MRVSAYVNAPYQGVSQAPPQARRPDQAELLEDSLVVVPEGWGKRPPWNWTGRLINHPGTTNGLFERIQRDGSLDAILTITNESGIVTPRLYLTENFPGLVNSETITISADAQAYLNSGAPNPVDDLTVLTVEDFTFIANRKVLIANQVGTAATRSPEAMIWVREAAYGRTYTVTVSPAGGTPVTVTLRTPDGTAATNSAYVDTDTIATGLQTGTYPSGTNGSAISGNLNSLTSQGFTVSRTGAVISLVRTTGGDFTVVVTDGQGGEAMPVIKDSVQTFSDLPKLAPNGFTVRIVQQGGSDADDYFVKFVLTAGTNTGVWEETIAPGAALGLDPKTMPVALVNNSGWHIDVQAWKGRTTGDASLVPDPDFIGQAVQDLSFWRNRLALLAGEGVTLSSAEDPLRFYPRTLATVLDSDPIALLNPTSNRSTIRYAVEFDTKLVAFGDIAQSQVTADGVVKPSTTRIELLTTYPFAPVGNTFQQPLRPQASNGRVYFLASRSKDWATIYELKVDNVINVTDADDLGTAFPRYVPAQSDRVANCPLNYIIAYGVSGASRVVLHCFRYSGQDRIQNAPMGWSMPQDHLLGGLFCRNTSIVALACVSGQAHVITADTAPGLLDPDSDRLLTCLDMKIDESLVTNLAYDPIRNVTSFNLPYFPPPTPMASVRAPGGVGGIPLAGEDLTVLPEGYVLPFQGYLRDTQYMELLGDYRETPFYVGIPYTARWRLSRLYAEPAPNAPIHTGRLQLGRIRADVDMAGYVRAEVTARGRDLRRYEWSGFKLDDPASLLDVAPSGSTGEFSFPIMTQNEQAQIDFVNDSHIPGTVQGFEWQGELNAKATRISGGGQ